MNTKQITVIDITETPEKVTATRVDITPTWGTIGAIIWGMIAGREWRALMAYRDELARVFAMAQALTDISKDLTDAQALKVANSITAEMKRQGF